MVGDAYELETLLELRERARDDAQEHLSVAVSELSTRERRVGALREELRRAKMTRAQRCKEFDEDMVRGGFVVGQVAFFSDYVERLKEEEREITEKIELARRAVIEQAAVIQQAKQHLTEAVKQLEAVESHKRSWEEEQARLKQRAHAVEMDEVAARIWRKSHG